MNDLILSPTGALNICLSGNQLILTKPQENKPVPKRERITSMSSSSATRMGKFLRECTANYKIMITLTYPSGCGNDGQLCKSDLHHFCQSIKRNYFKHDTDSIFWFMEFQKRGAIHFHLFVTCHFIPCKEVATLWTDIVFKSHYDKHFISNSAFKGSGEDVRVIDDGELSRPLNLVLDLYNSEQYQRQKECHLAAGTRVERLKAGRKGTVSYAAKYARKHEQKELPEGFGWCGRYWGIRGCRERNKVAKVCIPAFIPASLFDTVKLLNDLINHLDVVVVERYYAIYVVPDYLINDFNVLITHVSMVLNENDTDKLA